MEDHAQVIVKIQQGDVSITPPVTIAHIIYCKDCVHRPVQNSDPQKGPSISSPRQEGSWEYDETCPYLCDDSWYNRMPGDDCFCNFGERKLGG